ncbi:MAG: alpha/beta fold hydrolase [Ardenticatenaceae bacterium]|nr:alpha/beta fold hydrolase [Anaerolineales bacterium]MCB8921021.1 alpha/beta fold hydrolase [Ardenticatenaceae bacterium]MCB8991214.1 alpha/beta fold hydrolase [Ardenticatenaceae bacterium]MCB9004184.1 alpha/beta fold hydrolase [Ardenticatenaceae bacterium]
MRKIFFLIVLLALVLGACDTAEPTPTATAVPDVVEVVPTDTPVPVPTDTAVPPTNTPEPTTPPEPTATSEPTAVPQTAAFELADCQFEVPAGRDVQCGYLTVPEDHSNPDNGRTLRLHVAIFKSESANPAPDPIVYFEGGPGGDALESVPLIFEDRFAPFTANHDFIMFDQRGTGYSEPSLACPEYTDMAYDTLEMDLDLESEKAIVIETLQTCHDRLLAEDVNLAAYNSAQNAADVDALRQALGYEQWNLFGISYGTRLAQTVMRDYPEGIRSVILDSTYPLSADLNTEVTANAARAFNVFFTGCAIDPACDAAYPNLETTFYDLVDQLDAEPITVQVVNYFEGGRYDAVIQGDDLIGVLFQSLYSAELIPILPQLIYEVKDGNVQNLGTLLSSFMLNSEFMSLGMNYSVQCNEENAFSQPGEGAAAAAEFPQIAEGFIVGAEVDDVVCGFWGAGTADAIENEAVISDIPTLVLAGEYDPITPPSWGQQVAAELSNNYLFEYPGMGHGVSISADCPREMTLAFVADPTVAPDSTCIADMGGPAFAGTDEEAAPDVALVPVTVDLGFVEVEGVAPDGWEDVGFGSFARGQSALDQTAVVMQAVPSSLMDSEALLSLLAGQFQLEGALESSDTFVDENGREWTLYDTELQSFPVDLGLMDDGSYLYMVMMVSGSSERDALVTAVFQPAMSAIHVP